jgi:hypothetical protein
MAAVVDWGVGVGSIGAVDAGGGGVVAQAAKTMVVTTAATRPAMRVPWDMFNLARA